MKTSALLLSLTCFFYFSANAWHGPATKKKALIIAIGEYPKEGKWRNISSENDITYIKNGLYKAGFTENDIAVIKNSYATKANILQSLDSLIKKTKAGDIVLVHYSGHAYRLKQDLPQSPYKSLTYLIPYNNGCSLPDEPAKDCWNAFINTEEITAQLNRLRLAAGKSGQVIFTSDASHLGPEAVEKSANETTTIEKTRGGFFEEYSKIAKADKHMAPFVFLSACLSNQNNYEIKDDEGKAVGSFSLAFSKAMQALEGKPAATFNDLHQLIKTEVQKQLKLLLPTIAGDYNQYLFRNGNETATSITPKINLVKDTLKGNCYVISIGITNYQMSKQIIQTNNSVTDSKRMISFLSNQFLLRKTDTSKFIVYELLDDKATKKNIYNALNEVINKSKPDDYFIFNFCGYSTTYYDSVGKPDIFFAPFFRSDILDSAQIMSNGITLGNLKDLFELVAANNQLIITEAGSTENFQQLFVKKLFEGATALHQLSKRNRVLIVPNGYGLDEFYCGGERIAAGPLNHFITNLPSSINIFSLFSNRTESEKVEFVIKQAEMNCMASRGRPYSSFFFEKQFMNDLMYYMPEGLSTTRSSIVTKAERTNIKRTIKEKHALIIGTNKYIGKPDWTDLNNPALDAVEIDNELKRNYGFKTKMLLDPNLDAVYDALMYYSITLDSNDQFFLFIAGHGDYDGKFFDDGFLVFSNSAASKNDPFKKSYMQYAEFQKIINQFKAKNIFVMLDVCFGGTFDSKIAQQAFRTKNEDVYAPMDNTTFLSEKLRFRSRIYMTSGGKNVVPDGYDKMHSPFAKQFLKALRDATERGILTTSNIFTYVEALPSGPRKGTFGSDEPGSEFIFLAEKQ